MPDTPMDEFNRDLLERVPLSSRVLFDVGCGTGALGVAFQRLNPRAVLLGVDTDPDCIAVAAERLDQAALLDIEADPLPFRLEGGIDCIVYGDVLEHLREPWDLLRTHAEALTRDGTMLICIPNVEHWSFVARLLRGTWDYEPSGLLDEGHLRWFSLESMRRHLLAAGLVPYDVSPRVFDAEQCNVFVGLLTPALRELGIDPQDYARRARPLQYVWRIGKAARPRVTVAATMLAPVGGVSHVRVVYPLRALATDPAVQTQVFTLPNLPAVPPEGPRICVLHRPVLRSADGVELLRRLHAGGWLAVTEFDDHPDFLQAMQGGDQLTFTGVHAVQTSTPVLQELLRPRNPEVALFPNAMRELPDLENFADPERTTLFFGALNREADWAPLMPVLNEVAAAAGERLHFAVIHDRAFFDALETPHKQFTPTCDHETYLRTMAGCEIAFMPLADTPFNHAKSDLKFIEAGACGAAALASHVVYGASIKDGQTGLLFHDAAELRTKLLRLIAMPELARALGDAARDYVAAERMLAYQVAARTAWYRSLWERREALTAALRARVPGLLPAAVTPMHAG